MVRVWMLALIVYITVAGRLFAGSQAPPPAFRAEVYVVPVEFSVFTRFAFGLIKKPYKELAKDDVTVVLDKRTYQAVALTQDPKKPARHFVLGPPPSGPP